MKGPLRPGAALLDLAPTTLSCIRDLILKVLPGIFDMQYPRAVLVRGGPSPWGGKEGEQYATCIFGDHRSSFPAGGRGNGLKGAILNGISGQGAQVHRLRE